mmetsp:Transcript_15023/g.28350  ORF Transcript_15023/g.28350 Transcript_15023/m.28350 type:complete len:143 (+) Transcript_15023:2-430(+)
MEKVKEVSCPVPHEVSEELWNSVQDMCWAAVRTCVMGRKTNNHRTQTMIEQDRLSKNTRLFGEAAARMVKEDLPSAKFHDMLMEFQLGAAVRRRSHGRDAVRSRSKEKRSNCMWERPNSRLSSRSGGSHEESVNLLSASLGA